MHKKISLPLVSIIIPCYNHEQFVQETIQSIIEQDYQNIELIIIDDGSQDNSVSKIKEMIPECKKRFARFEFRHRPNKGLCATLNEAIEWIKGEYYSAIASDDIMFKNKTSIQIQYFLNIQDPSLVGLFTGFSIIDKHKNIIKTKGKSSKFGFNELFLRTSIITTPTLMLITNKVKSINGYDENIEIEDFDLFLRLSANGGTFHSIKNSLVYYRRHENNLSNNNSLMLDALNAILYKYKDHPKYHKALSKNMMVEAHSKQRLQPTKSCKDMASALKIYPMNIFSLSFIKYVIKFLLPN